jgi:hypothetical protein
MKVDKQMAQKFNDFISNDIPFIANKKREMQKNNVELDKIERTIQHDLQKISKSLMNSNIHELNPLLDKYKNKENELLKKLFSLQKEGQKVGEEDYIHQIHFELIITCIQDAISLKREYRKKYNSHILEKNFIKGGVFLSGTPHKNTMSRLTGGDILELERRGFRPMTYKNDNGALLNTYDTRVLVGLFKLWLNQGMKQTIEFEFKDLAEAMLTKPSGGEYKLIHQSLKNIAATWVEYKEYFDPNTSRFYSATIQHRPIKSLAWIARTPDEEDGKQRAAVLTFHDVLHESLKAGNYVFINMVIYNELPTSYARNIYLNILDAIEHGRYTFDLDTLIDHIILRDGENEETFNRSRTIRTIETSFRHLKDADIITDFELRKVRRKLSYIDFTPSEWLQGHRGGNSNSELDTAKMLN